MNIRAIDLDKDYLEISQWFVGHGWPAAPDKSMLPKTGFIVEVGKRLLACGFLYLTNSPIAWLEWTATNPKETELTRMKAFGALVKSAQSMATSSGYSRIMQAMPNAKLVSFYEKRLGFKKAEDASILFWNGEGN